MSLALAALLAAAVPGSSENPGGLPAGFQWGRCLLEIGGRTYLSGACSYHVERGGSVEMHGARQTWERECNNCSYADYISTDWFVLVDVEGGSAEGHWNEDPGATHAQSRLGPLVRLGACWVNPETRICLWRQ